MTTLLDPEIIRAAGKPPPNSFEDAPNAPDAAEAEEGDAEESEEEG